MWRAVWEPGRALRAVHRAGVCHSCLHSSGLLSQECSSAMTATASTCSSSFFLPLPLDFNFFVILWQGGKQAAGQGLSLSWWCPAPCFWPQTHINSTIANLYFAYLQPPFTCPSLMLSGIWLLRNYWQTLWPFLKDSELRGVVHLFQRTRWIKAHGFLVTLGHSSCSRAFSEWWWSHQRVWRRKMQKRKK